MNFYELSQKLMNEGFDSFYGSQPKKGDKGYYKEPKLRTGILEREVDEDRWLMKPDPVSGASIFSEEMVEIVKWDKGLKMWEVTPLHAMKIPADQPKPFKQNAAAMDKWPRELKRDFIR